MGNLINPLSRILGFKKNIFWGNNFSFYYFQDVYRQKIFKIKCFKRIFKYIFRNLFKFFNIPRVNYSIKFNFVGQANSILNIQCEVRNLHLYNMASVLVYLNNDNVMEVQAKYNTRYGVFNVRSRLQIAIRFVKMRWEKLFIKWRSYLIKLYLQKIKKKKQIHKTKITPIKGQNFNSYGRLRKILKFGEHFAITKDKYYNINLEFGKIKFNLNLLKTYFKIKFKLISSYLKLYRSLSNKYFVNVFNFMFKLFFNKINFNFGIKNIQLNFKRKKNNTSAIVRDINHFCYLALRKGYRINYVIKIIRQNIRFLKVVRGFQMVVSGRFYRRGRAMFKISTFGEMGSQSGKGSLMYRNSERIKEYGMCSVKLLFFFRRRLKIKNKIPLRCKWFHYLKFLRADRKIRNYFGYIRY